MIRGSIFSKKRLKIEALLDVIGRQQYLMLALAGQIYIILLMSVADEFYGVLGISHSALLNGLSLISLVVLALQALVQWRRPISNAVPLIVLVVWIMLSTQGNSYCVCCGGEGDTIGVAARNTTIAEVVVTNIAQEGEGRLHEREHTDGLYVMELWTTHVEGCRRDSLLFLYSLAGLVLLLASLFSDLRFYWLALLNRIVVGLLAVVLLVMLVISPTSCSQYHDHESSSAAMANFILVMRITLYHLVWFMNQYKDVTELILSLCYGQGVALSDAIMDRLGLPGARRLSAVDTTPRGVLQQLDDNAVKVKRRVTTIVDTTDCAHGETVIQIEGYTDNEQTIHMASLLAALVDHGHRLYYSDAWLGNVLSWKHRAYGRTGYYLICLGRTVWVLLVSPLIMFIAVPLMMAWLLYHIARNKRELRHACKHTGLLEYYVEYRQQYPNG